MTEHHRPRTRNAVEQLFRDHHHRLVAQLENRLDVSRELAEDACCRAWEQLLRRQPAGDPVLGWLYTVAKHEAFDLLAHTRRETPVDTLPAAASFVDLDDVVDARMALRLIARLKPQQQQVLWLRAEGHSYHGVAALTGRTFTWVNRHLTEGRHELRRLIEHA